MYDARPAQVIQVGTLAAQALTSTGVFGYNQVLLENCTISRLLLKITTAIVSSANVVVSFWARPTYGSATNEIALGTVSVPTGALANSLYFSDINPIDVPANYQIVAEITTAAVGGSAAGGALSGFLQQYDPETAANMNMIAGS